MQFDRFSNKLNRVIKRAEKLADFYSKKKVSFVDILNALLLEKGSLALEVLFRSGLDLGEKKEGLLPSDLEKNKRTGVELDAEVIKLLNKAITFAMQADQYYVGTEHLLFVMIDVRNKEVDDFFRDKKINREDVVKSLKNIFLGYDDFSKQDLFYEFDHHKVDEAINGILQNINSEEQNMKQSNLINKLKTKNNKNQTYFLDNVSRNLTDQKNQKNIDPVIGRKKEIDRIIQILSRRNKNNPVLIGDPGVGKTAIVEGLAKKILNQDVPDVLLSKKIFNLDVNSLVAGSAVRGEFEQKLKQIIDEVSADEDIILFIDEIHMIVGAGAVPGSMDAANILKPALSRGDVRCIGATTFEDYKKSFEDDPALERRFQSVIVDEPSRLEAVDILKGIKENYESHHMVEITDEALQVAVDLSIKYIPERFLPDKAIDLIDEAAARVKVDAGASDIVKKIKKTENKLNDLIDKKKEALLGEKYDEAVVFSEEEKKVIDNIIDLEQDFLEIKKVWIGKVGPLEIKKIISSMKQIPIEDLEFGDDDRIAGLEKKIKKNIFGQDKAIEDISFLIKKTRAGLGDETKPIASLLLVGPSGVGKTETAKVLAKEIFGSEKKLIRFDMSEFSESFNISKLIGSPAGYVGYKEGGRLTEAVKKKPYSVVLFDEIEKAHPNVFNLLLQVMGEGELSDGAGKKINFKNTIVVVTSNIGSESDEESEIGFEKNIFDIKKDNNEQIKKYLTEYLSPEFVGRVDKVVVYKSLNKKVLIRLVKREIEKIVDKIKIQKNIKVHYAKDLVDFLSAKSFAENQGAREVIKVVRTEFESGLVDKILENKNLEKIEVKVEKGKIIFL